FYSLTVCPNLFGEWSLQREWGRCGRGGQMRISFFPSREKALLAFHRLKAAKIKRGYQVIPEQLSMF
ncbi:WGR domain-containing protein, partial [Bacillus anthracis]|uniref:WGR domain-containing protein n=1 Tax=Bacillus anthracis TaxID=1392 RepID=UPI0039A4BDF7